MWSDIWDYIYFTLIHPWLKWLLRTFTGKCELLRITYEEQRNANRTLRTEASLKHSKNKALSKLVEQNVNEFNVDAAVAEIVKIKSVKMELHPLFSPSMKTCLSQICGYNKLVLGIESIRKTPYSSEDQGHEHKLLQLWQKLKPNVQLDQRISKMWTDIGFQGNDPATDFRGMGFLGLQNLLYFATEHTETARQILSHSDHPQHGFSFAVVGINLTGLVHQLLISGALKTHFYNLVLGRPRIDHFHDVYCYIFVEFDKYWFAVKPNIMQFNQVKETFLNIVLEELKDKTCTLTFDRNLSSRYSAVQATNVSEK